MDLNQITRYFSIPSPIQIHPLSGGANNRVYQLIFEQHPSLILKQYFQHEKDQRPRLQSEFSFLEYAWNIGMRAIPEPLFCSLEANAGLYSYIPARSVQLSDVNAELVEQMISFFLNLNTQKEKAIHLLPASEACFSASDYLSITELRIMRLYRNGLKNREFDKEAPQNASLERMTIAEWQGMSENKHSEGKPTRSKTDSSDYFGISQHGITTSLEKELKQFLKYEMLPKWTSIKMKCKAALQSFDKPLTLENRCMSPSDFGFHNSLLANGKLTFIDFEYAGWDDPCKTVCDLFCQPKIPLSIHYFPTVVNAVSTCVNNPEAFRQRVDLFYPVIQMKWCCILLNAFTHVGKSRRGFSHSDEMQQLEKQLALAKAQIQRISL